LFGMTIISAFVGSVLIYLPPLYTHYAVIGLLVYFGFMLLREGLQKSDGESEYEKLEEEVANDLAQLALKSQNSKKKEDSGTIESSLSSSVQISNSASLLSSSSSSSSLIFWKVAAQALTLTFVAEWGDRSQIATIALAATNPVFAVILGGCMGHAVATSMAVLAGRFLKEHVSEKTVQILGGLAFFFFAALTLYEGPKVTTTLG